MSKQKQNNDWWWVLIQCGAYLRAFWWHNKSNLKAIFTYQCKGFDGTMPCINWELFGELRYDLQIELDELAEDSFLQLRDQPFRNNFYENFSTEGKTKPLRSDRSWHFLWREVVSMFTVKAFHVDEVLNTFSFSKTTRVCEFAFLLVSDRLISIRKWNLNWER